MTAEPVPNGSTPTQILGLGQFVQLLWRHAWLIALCGIAGAVVTTLYVRSLPKVYTAEAAISVEGADFVIPELQGAVGRRTTMDPMPAVRTETQAIASRALLQSVIRHEHLAQNPEFNSGLRPPGLIDLSRAWLRGLLPVLSTIEPPPSGIDELVLNTVRENLSIFQDNRSLVVALSFTARDPKVAADFLNELVAEYVQTRAQGRTSVNAQANEVLSQRTVEAKAALDVIDNQMQALRDKSEMVQLRAGSVGQQQLEDLASAAARASVLRSQLEANWTRAVELSKAGMSDALQGVLNSQTIASLRQQEGVAASNLASVTARYGSAYPGVRSAAANLAAIRSALSAEVARVIQSMTAQLKAARDDEIQIKQQLEVARHRGVLGENARAQLDQLQQEERSRRLVYQTLLERSQQTIVQSAGNDMPEVRLMSGAVPPGSPSGPNVKLSAGFGALAGLLFGCVMALSRRATIGDYASPGLFGLATGVAVLATVDRKMIEGGRNSWGMRVLRAPDGDEAAAARSIRQQIKFSGRSRVPKSILFTSVDDRSNALAVALAVARVATADGETALFIDTDTAEAGSLLRADSRTDGHTDLLARGMEWREAIVPDSSAEAAGGSRLDTLKVGRQRDQERALRTDVGFRNLLLEAGAEYDVIILSGQHAESSDATSIAQSVDTTVLVVDARVKDRTLNSLAARMATFSRNPIQVIVVR